VLILGEGGWLVRPFTLVYTGSEQAERALQLATRLARRTDQPLHVILPMSRDDAEHALDHLTEALVGQGISIRVTQGTDGAALSRLLQTAAKGTLILPAEHVDQLARLKGSVILVP
jgi:hypothetical protein